MTLAEDRLIEHYRRHGFSRVVIRRDEPHFVYPIHFHAYDLAFQIIEGSMSVTVNHHTTVANPGDHVLVPANQLHSVRIGAHGCVFIHAEKPAQHVSTGQA